MSRVERYLECPFKYFAAHVLKLPEERDEESGLSAQERGQFLHGVFEQFFTRWQAEGHGTVTTANIDEALTMFEEVAEARLATLPESDRAVERTHLLGSAAAAGLAERAFTFEIEQGGQVIERLLEHELEGEFVFRGRGWFAQSAAPRQGGPDRPACRRYASPDRLQTRQGAEGIEGAAAARVRRLRRAGARGTAWPLMDAEQAGYVAFREKNPFVELGGSSSLAEAVASGQERFLAAIDGIERGEFPPDPDEPYRCTWCGYASVCRKDYVGDE